MASTYTTNQGLEKPATGDRSGTWGTMTNTNMDMLDRSISGVGALSLTGTTTTLTTSDGSASDGNYKVLVLGGSPSGTNTITLSPNDGDKLYFVVNATGESVIFSQGTGANVTIANGAADIIYADGAGGGAAVASVLANDLVFKTGDGVILNLQTSDTTVTAASVLGRLNFTAPDEASGTDAILLAASIAAISEGTFAADNNATKLSFLTGASAAASEVMSLSSGGNLTLPTDGVVIAAGLNSDVTLTHVHDTGLLLNSTMALQFNDASQYINAPSATVLDINATDEVEINATLADVNANLDVSGTYTGGGLMTTGGNIVIPDGGNIGSATTPTAIDILGTGEVGVGAAGSTGAQLKVYDNTTGRAGISVHLDNASSAQNGIAIACDGSGNAINATTSAGLVAAIYGLGTGYAIEGKTTTAAYGGVIGRSQDNSAYGILGAANGHGLHSTSVYTTGALVKGSGTFRISHPLKSEIEGENWDLCHSFIEGPQCDLIYRGRVTLVDGQASIYIDNHYGMTPGTFEWLTKADDVQCFTSNETGWDAVRSSFSGDTITIECQNPASIDTISWMVIAERGDPNIIGSTITDDEGNLIIERPSEPEPPVPELDA
jgi:hypothetical protein